MKINLVILLIVISSILAACSDRYPDRTRQTMRSAWKAYTNKHYEAAIPLLTTSLLLLGKAPGTNDSIYFELLAARGSSYLFTTQYLHAAEDLSHCISMGVSNEIVFIQLAMANGLLGNHNDVIAITDKAIQQGTSNAWVYVLRASAYRALDIPIQALDSLNVAISNAPELILPHKLKEELEAELKAK